MQTQELKLLEMLNDLFRFKLDQFHFDSSSGDILIQVRARRLLIRTFQKEKVKLTFDSVTVTNRKNRKSIVNSKSKVTETYTILSTKIRLHIICR